MAMEKRALMKYYARLVRKGQFKLEEIDPKYHDAVKDFIQQYEEEEKKLATPVEQETIEE